MSFKILAHYVAVKPFEVDEWDDTRKQAKALGLVLPDEDKRAKASVDVGTVLQIGPDAVTEVQVGDVVAYVKNAGKFIINPFTKKEVYALNDTDILCILSPFNKETADV